jgi:hypothetical protein
VAYTHRGAADKTHPCPPDQQTVEAGEGTSVLRPDQRHHVALTQHVAVRGRAGQGTGPNTTPIRAVPTPLSATIGVHGGGTVARNSGGDSRFGAQVIFANLQRDHMQHREVATSVERLVDVQGHLYSHSPPHRASRVLAH